MTSWNWNCQFHSPGQTKNRSLTRIIMIRIPKEMTRYLGSTNRDPQTVSLADKKNNKKHGTESNGRNEEYLIKQFFYWKTFCYPALR